MRTHLLFYNKLLLLNLFAFSMCSFSTTEHTTYTTNVFICDSDGGKKYHFNKKCRGLSKCNHQIKEIPLKKAQNIDKTLCGWED